jgi:adenine phosphoribosyltransferase
MLEILVSSLKDKKIDKVIGVESRFFLRDADRSGTERRFRAVRKPNKLLTTPFQLPMSWNTGQIH